MMAFCVRVGSTHRHDDRTALSPRTDAAQGGASPSFSRHNPISFPRRGSCRSSNRPSPSPIGSASPAERAANRARSEKPSTGPRTQEGEDASRSNAVTRGLTASLDDVVTPCGGGSRGVPAFARRAERRPAAAGAMPSSALVSRVAWPAEPGRSCGAVGVGGGGDVSTGR